MLAARRDETKALRRGLGLQELRRGPLGGSPVEALSPRDEVGQRPHGLRDRGHGVRACSDARDGEEGRSDGRVRTRVLLVGLPLLRL